MSNSGGGAGLALLKLTGIVLALMVIGFGVIKYQDDVEACRHGKHNVQCPAPPPRPSVNPSL